MSLPPFGLSRVAFQVTLNAPFRNWPTLHIHFDAFPIIWKAFLELVSHGTRNFFSLTENHDWSWFRLSFVGFNSIRPGVKVVQEFFDRAKRENTQWLKISSHLHRKVNQLPNSFVKCHRPTIHPRGRCSHWACGWGSLTTFLPWFVTFFTRSNSPHDYSRNLLSCQRHKHRMLRVRVA